MNRQTETDRIVELESDIRGLHLLLGEIGKERDTLRTQNRELEEAGERLKADIINVHFPRIRRLEQRLKLAQLAIDHPGSTYVKEYHDAKSEAEAHEATELQKLEERLSRAIAALRFIAVKTPSEESLEAADIYERLAAATLAELEK